MMFMMWYAAQQQQQLKKIDNASNNGISIADKNDDRYTMQIAKMMIDIRCNCKDKISQCIYNTITVYDDDILCWQHDSDIQ